MKYLLFTLLSVIGLSFTGSAQNYSEENVERNVNNYIQNIERSITLTKEEKATLYKLKRLHTIEFWDVSAKYKDTPELAEKRKEVGKKYGLSLVEAFGRARANEIGAAARVKKE